jgi:oxygen-independent coproporphyrinogen-3 oxidase
VRDGRLAPVGEESDRAMYRYAVRALSDAGYEHYEISNAARPGFRCRHNLKYWSMDEYLGLGLGAHSYADGVRFSNTEDLHTYIAAAGGDSGASFRAWQHVNAPADTIAEYMFLGLRRIEGISARDFSSKFGVELRDRFGGEIAGLTDEGLLERRGDMLRLTPMGVDVSNRVFSAFV